MGGAFVMLCLVWGSGALFGERGGGKDLGRQPGLEWESLKW